MDNQRHHFDALTADEPSLELILSPESKKAYNSLVDEYEKMLAVENQKPLTPAEAQYLRVLEDKNLMATARDLPAFVAMLLLYSLEGVRNNFNPDWTPIEKIKINEAALKGIWEKLPGFQRTALSVIVEQLLPQRAYLLLEYRSNNKDILTVARDTFVIFLENQIVQYASSVEIPAHYMKLVPEARRKELEIIADNKSTQAVKNGNITATINLEPGESPEDAMESFAASQRLYDYNIHYPPELSTETLRQLEEFEDLLPSNHTAGEQSAENDGGNEIAQAFHSVITKYPDPRLLFDKLFNCPDGQFSFDKEDDITN